MNKIWQMQIFLWSLLLTTTVHSQEGLIGTWHQIIEEEEEDAAGSFVLKLKADGTMEFDIKAHFGPDFLDIGEDEAGELPDIPFFTEGFWISIVIPGSWEATETQITFSVGTASVAFNGLSSGAFVEGLARDVAAARAVELEVSEADFPAYEEEAVALLLEELDPQELEELFSSNFAEDWDVQFSLDEERLIFIDEFGFEEAAYVRAEISSAVVGISWGQLKARGR